MGGGRRKSSKCFYPFNPSWNDTSQEIQQVEEQEAGDRGEVEPPEPTGTVVSGNDINLHGRKDG